MASRLGTVSELPRPNLSRICPWCADVTVIAFTQEGLLRALARHLAGCSGPASSQP